MSTVDNDSITKEGLFNLLENVRDMIENESFSTADLYSIRDDLKSIISHENTSLDPEAVRCIVTGWWVRDSIRSHGIDPDNPPSGGVNPNKDNDNNSKP